MAILERTDRATRTAGLVAGIGILALAVLSGFANFAVVESLVTEGDATRTARDILASEQLFRIGVLCLVLAAVLDIVVAWALMVFFRPVHENLSTLTAWLRLTYAGVFLVAISQLAGVLPLLHAGENAEALAKIDTFHDSWNAGFVLFGLHLVLLGCLAYLSGYVPKLVGVLVVVAGLGYLVDSVGKLLSAGYPVEVATVTFVGEVVLFVWLLAKGRSITGEGEAP